MSDEIRSWLVSGYALIPVKAEVLIDAADEQQAIQKARQAWTEDKGRLLVSKSEDLACAFEWLPHAEIAQGPLSKNILHIKNAD